MTLPADASYSSHVVPTALRWHLRPACFPPVHPCSLPVPVLQRVFEGIPAAFELAVVVTAIGDVVQQLHAPFAQSEPFTERSTRLVASLDALTVAVAETLPIRARGPIAVWDFAQTVVGGLDHFGFGGRAISIAHPGHCAIATNASANTVSR